MDPRFSDSRTAHLLIGKIASLMREQPSVRIMEVCGTHTMEIGRLGIRSLLPGTLELLSGPGCPVCVTPGSYIDNMVALALERNVRIATFGDMVRVPGSHGSLGDARSRGGGIDILTSPIQAVDLAASAPDEQVVFTAVGFETTAPATARAVELAHDKGLKNLTFFVAHRLVPPALDLLIHDADLGLSGFLLPGHVSAVIGENAYSFLSGRPVPGVIAGFEPLDILGAIASLLEMIAHRLKGSRNEYTRLVKREGNPAALALIDRIYEPCDAAWRGIGTIPGSGLKLRDRYAPFDAALRFGLSINETTMPQGCSCGAVLRGVIRPDQCPMFGAACTPDNPVGPCMVSSEGSCAAMYKYGN